MSIFKIHKSENFTIVDNRVINDNRLSWKARGVLIFLLSKPNNWIVRMSYLESMSEKDGQTALQSALKELREFGYAELIRGEFKDENGNKKFGSFYNISETPIK